MLQETMRLPTGQPAAATIWSRPYRLLTTGLILTVSAAAFEALAVATTMPATARELGGLGLYGWAFSAYMLANLVGTTLAGGEADRRGPARPFAVGVTIFAAGLLLGGFAPTMPVLIGARTVQGLGAGMIGAIAYLAIGRGYPEALKARMIAVMSSAWVIPGLIGPAVAGLIGEYAGWRWVFLGLAPLPPLALAMTLPALRRLDRASDAPRDWTRISAALRLAGGTGLFMAGLTTLSPVVTPVLVLLGLGLGLPALRRLLPAGTLRAAPGLPAAIAANGLLSLAFFGADAFVPLGLTEGRGQSATIGGLALTAATLTWTTGAWLQAHYAARRGRNEIAVVGLVLTALAIGGFIATLHPAVPPLLALVAWAIAGLGVGLAFSTASLAVLETARPGEDGAAASALQLSNMLGAAIGAGVGGVFVAYATARGANPAGGIAAHDLLMIGVIGLALAAAGRLPGRPRQSAAESRDNVAGVTGA